MSKSYIIFGFALATVLLGTYLVSRQNPSLKSSTQTTYERFQTWKAQYNKIYSEEEELFRYKNFLETVEFVDNFKSDTMTVGLNLFSDLSQEEFEAKHLGRRKQNEEEQVALVNPERSDFFKGHSRQLKLGDSFTYQTWEGTMFVPPIQNQGDCGSCWAFAAAEALSSFQTINNPNLGMIFLSPQQITDCSFASTYNGCDGGDFDAATNFTAQYGVTTNDAYPYTSGSTDQSGPCQIISPIYYPNKGHLNIGRNYQDFANVMTAGPVKVSIQANQNVFQSYTSGVISQDCGLILDHDVLAVGWSDETAVAQIQNSWGTAWGMNGTAFLNGTSNYGLGACGFLRQVQKPSN